MATTNATTASAPAAATVSNKEADVNTDQSRDVMRSRERDNR